MPSSDSERPARKSTVSRGRQYEQQAAQFYESKGFEIVEHNWQAGHKEIDLIVRKDDLLVFVEVKYSSSQRFGHPAERVDKRKIGHLTDAANRYIVEHDIADCDLRFDVVTFTAGRLEHFPDAFQAE
jgi:putative endonuclease